jgi:hypothetical protein
VIQTISSLVLGCQLILEPVLWTGFGQHSIVELNFLTLETIEPNLVRDYSQQLKTQVNEK